MGIFDGFLRMLGMKKKEASVIVVGLDNSGKSTVLNYLKPEESKVHDIVPTIGFNVEKFKVRSIEVTAFDMSGQGRYRDLWKAYYKDCNGIIFVIDSSDKLRMVVVKDELEDMLSCAELKGKRLPILFLANKMDLHGALSSVKVSSSLQLEDIKDKPWFICATNALTGEGIEEGTCWLEEEMKEALKKR